MRLGVLHHLHEHLGHPRHPRRSGMRPGVLHCCHRHWRRVRLNGYIRLNKYMDKKKYTFIFVVSTANVGAGFTRLGLGT